MSLALFVFQACRRRTRLLAVAGAAVLSAAAASPTMASCSDRPGTPTDVSVSPQEGALSITWRDTTRPGDGSCHDIEVKHTGDGDLSHSVTGGVCLTGGTNGSFVVGNLPYDQQYCIRIKARDHAGTKGCVSANWSATVCASTLNPPFSSGGGGGGNGVTINDVEPGIDRPGYDTARFVLKASDYRLCQTECKISHTCAAWTYVKPNTVQGPEPLCYLKNQIPSPRRGSCCISGGKLPDVR